MVISELVREIKKELSDNAAFEAAEIVMFTLGIDRTSLLLCGKNEVSETDAEKAFSLARRRRSGEPLAYILGFAEFMSLTFEVNGATLIPRSDTETLVEYVLEKARGRRIRLLDIGTGTGCIGISIAKYHGDTVLSLADISRKALETAAVNAERNGVKAELMRLDILNELPRGVYDIIVSNPPYIKSGVIPTLQTEVKDHEPVTALDGGEDGLVFYRRIAGIAPKLLNKGGMLVFEIGYDQGESVSEIMKKSFCGVEVIKDLCGNDRVAGGVFGG